MGTLSASPPPAGGTAGGALIALTLAVDRGVALLCQGVILLTGTALMVVMSANVVARYVLAAGGFDWAEEVPQQLFPWFIMAGVALAVQRGGHIAVEWLMGFLGREGRRAVLLAGHALVVLAYAILCQQALQVAEIVAIERSPALGLAGSYGYWAIAAGCVLIAVGTVTIGIRIALTGPEALPTPSPEEIPT
ncbi:TRAP transporter small permease [Roseomonas nepalensis]|uniref:TRAP transporter small permease protein n=1 Tax=Muricoccus nepalensis TaxID=1854500 RepID=A0A502G5L7_9PROT|nr:TRAP transporter small permease [Roseomonas nepalensis]TPG57129.1 TRAP transporter small permease [Roseomonas nepalensis]